MKTAINHHRRLMQLLTQQGYDADARHELVWQFTSMRTESTRELSDSEVRELCSFLEQQPTNAPTPAEQQLVLRKRRATVLAIATRTGIHDTNDWAKFNRFMLNSSILKKPLKDYNLPELNRLMRQFSKLEENYNQSAEKPLNKAWWHRGKRLSSLN